MFVNQRKHIRQTSRKGALGEILNSSGSGSLHSFYSTISLFILFLILLLCPAAFLSAIFHFRARSLIAHCLFQRSSLLLGQFISMFSSPTLPPPLFHPKHISQPRLSASLTSYPSAPLLSSRRHYSPAAAVHPDLSAPCPLPFISSKFLFFIVSQCLFFTPVSVRVCVFGVRSTHTPIGCSPFIPSDSAGWSGQGEKK